MRNFHQAKRGCFRVFLFRVRLYQIPTLWEETMLYKMYILNVWGGWVGQDVIGRGGACKSCLTLPFKNCTGNSLGVDNQQRPTGSKSVLMSGSRSMPKSHEDVHEHARPILNPHINTNQREEEKKPFRAQPRCGFAFPGKV